MMNKTDVVTKVSGKTGIAPDICGQVIAALEQVLQEELAAKPGVGLVNRFAGFLHSLTAPRQD